MTAVRASLPILAVFQDHSAEMVLLRPNIEIPLNRLL